MCPAMPDWIWHREGLGWCGLSAFTTWDRILGLVRVAIDPDLNPTGSGGTRLDRVAAGGMEGLFLPVFFTLTRPVRVAPD